MVLDQATLFMLATSITGLLGMFLLVLWLQERSMRALAWWGGAYLMGASAVTLWGVQGMAFVPLEFPNAPLFIACGMIWSGARLFHGRAVLSGALFAGAAVWFVGMQFPDFAASGQARVVLSSLVIAFYAFLTAFELRRERRRELATRFLWIAIPMLHRRCVPGAGRIDRGAAEGHIPRRAVRAVRIRNRDLCGRHGLRRRGDGEGTRRDGAQDRGDDRPAHRSVQPARLHRSGQPDDRAAWRKSQPISVMMFDLDRFKSINDRFGHSVGDHALKVFAAAASANVRASDVPGRLGGEEFAAIIPGNAADAGLVAERLRVAFQAAGVVISGHEIGATVSIGIVTATAPAQLDALLARGDSALYRAKHNGRNRVEFDQYGGQPFRAPQPIPAPGQTLAALR